MLCTVLYVQYIPYADVYVCTRNLLATYVNVVLYSVLYNTNTVHIYSNNSMIYPMYSYMYIQYMYSA